MSLDLLAKELLVEELTLFLGEFTELHLKMS